MEDNKSIFISYRRNGTTAYAGWLEEMLENHFGQQNVFRDIGSIEPGMDFVEALERALEACAVMLVVISRDWAAKLKEHEQTGQEDYTRLEIATALKRNVRVIPLLVQGASMPRAEELPEDLAALRRRQAKELHDTNWESDVENLIAVLEKIVGRGEEGTKGSQSLQERTPTDLDQGTIQVTQIELATNRKLIAQLREDATDIQPFLAELIRVMVRLNPVNIQIHAFLGFINEVTENTTPQQKAQLVQDAMESVDLTNAVFMLDEALDSVTSMGPELVKSYTSDLASVWPESRQLVRHRWLDDPIKEGENLQQQLRRAVQAHRQDLIVIQNRFRQLQEFYPRYHALMTRNSFWGSALGFAAGFAGAFFGGRLGVRGAEAGAQFWDDWHSKSDLEFVQTFSNAVVLFSEAALSFTQKTEEEVEYVVIGLLKDLDDFTQGVIAALESVAESMDITAIYHKLHDPDPSDKLDDDGIQVMEIVLFNLREQKISARSESNLREMMGIRLDA